MKAFAHPEYPWVPEDKYWISETGEVFKKTKKGMAPVTPHLMSNGGYMHRICGKGHNRSVTRATLVMLTYGESRPSTGHKVHHKDGNPLNDAPENLQWRTEKEISQIRMKNPENLRRVQRMGTANRTLDPKKRRRLSAEERQYVRHALRTYVPDEQILEKLQHKITKAGLGYYRRKLSQELARASDSRTS